MQFNRHNEVFYQFKNPISNISRSYIILNLIKYNDVVQRVANNATFLCRFLLFLRLGL